MKTKEKILSKSLELFNDKGLTEITLRKIALELGISQGNLNYHFARREDILYALYLNLVEEINVVFLSSGEKELDLNFMFELGSVIFESFYKYRFLMLDFVQVMRENPKIKAHYIELSKQRKQQFLVMFELLEAKGVLKPQAYEGQYDSLYIRLSIMSDFWVASAFTTHQKVTEQIKQEYLGIINASIYPYLTIKGQKDFKMILM